MSPADKEAVEAFRRTVVEPSMTKLVIIDFWAEWCGPCKALAPILDKVAAEYADKGVVLAKIDTDKDQFIAAQFQIRSIPTIYAMFQGQLVADLSQARTESQLKQTLDQLLRQLPVDPSAAAPGEDDGMDDIAPLIAMGDDVLAGGDAARALSIFDQIADMAPDVAEAQAGRLRALVALGRMDDAAAVLAALPDDAAKLPGVDQARAAITLAAEAQPVDDLSALKAQVAANPDDHALRYDLAGGQMAAGDRDGAVDSLLAIITAERDWNDGAARQRLLKLFEAVGLEDPWVSAQRRRLSAALFG
ncbi:tetratricopeptide repeat protein [Sphingomonas sp. BGYR3]|uniref:tetratricopeptide repeat protein n=1 Tax=Sphingomonas sp. BGYR3 TaxID=2975483 RepID=UPI0021A5460B|nr:tetratricopeptide repeat protein [Sphingomonas sp. BGYR3]MDG5489052.1 tetratricopeptide repeat protein [Sphingomonas sp. BGYR3]